MKYIKISFFLLALLSCKSEEVNIPYLGQTPPGMIPEVFFKDTVSEEDRYEFGSVFTKEGSTLYFGIDDNGKSEIHSMSMHSNGTIKEEIVLSDSIFSYNDPFLSPDESKLYFISNRALDQSREKKDIDIWSIPLKTHIASPINAGPNINSDKNEYYISFTDKGDMYFSSNFNAGEQSFNYDIYRSELKDGVFMPPIALSDSINTTGYEADVFISPDESYMIFSSFRTEGFGQGDLYISLKNQDGTWSKSKNMGPAINTSSHELCPFVTNDGNYFFYTSDEDIYWVDFKLVLEIL